MEKENPMFKISPKIDLNSIKKVIVLLVLIWSFKIIDDKGNKQTIRKCLPDMMFAREPVIFG